MINPNIDPTHPRKPISTMILQKVLRLLAFGLAGDLVVPAGPCGIVVL